MREYVYHRPSKAFFKCTWWQFIELKNVGRKIFEIHTVSMWKRKKTYCVIRFCVLMKTILMYFYGEKKRQSHLFFHGSNFEETMANFCIRSNPNKKMSKVNWILFFISLWIEYKKVCDIWISTWMFDITYIAWYIIFSLIYLEYETSVDVPFNMKINDKIIPCYL
jgi:hypothetical protein